MPKPTYIFFGHHRSASTWTLNILIALCKKLNLSIARYHEIGDKGSQPFNFVADINAEWNHREKFDRYLGFHIIRDPRDIVVSAYFSHKLSHPEGEWLEKQRKLLNEIDLNEGIRASIDFRERQFKQMMEWGYGLDQNIYETKYETVTLESIQEFKSIFEFLGIYPKLINEKQLTGLLEQHSFEKITGGRHPGQEDEKHHYRKGISGDWKNYFDDENKSYFKDKYGQLLIKLGYEQDLNW